MLVLYSVYFLKLWQIAGTRGNYESSMSTFQNNGNLAIVGVL